MGEQFDSQGKASVSLVFAGKHGEVSTRTRNTKTAGNIRYPPQPVKDIGFRQTAPDTLCFPERYLTAFPEIISA